MNVGMKSSSLFDLEAYVQHMALGLALTLDSDSFAGVVRNLTQLEAIAPLVMDFSLPPDVELAPTFQP
jgi:hypothetical protein